MSLCECAGKKHKCQQILKNCSCRHDFMDPAEVACAGANCWWFPLSWPWRGSRTTSRCKKRTTGYGLEDRVSSRAPSCQGRSSAMYRLLRNSEWFHFIPGSQLFQNKWVFKMFSVLCLIVSVVLHSLDIGMFHCLVCWWGVCWVDVKLQRAKSPDANHISTQSM